MGQRKEQKIFLIQILQRIHSRPADDNLEMHMRSGAPSGTAAARDRLILIHLLSYGHQDLAQVRVAGLPPVRMA